MHSHERASEDQAAGGPRGATPQVMPVNVVGEAPAPGRAGPVSPAQVLQLQRTAGNAAAVGVLAGASPTASGGMGRRGGRFLQRLLVGVDPLNDLQRPEARGLVYGMSPARLPTSKRLNQVDMLRDDAPYRTVDEYNLAAGINHTMGVGGKEACIGIFKIREALAEADPVAAWNTHFPQAEDPNANDDLAEWITFLAAKKQYVGLYDLGATGGTNDTGHAKAAAKHRLEKNLKSQQHAKDTTITPGKISDWLRADRTPATAAVDVDTDLNAQEQQDLGKWMYTAFFRRTSKLGIDFTVARGETLHMNIAADPTWDPSNPTLPNMVAGGLDIIQHNDPDQFYGRAITSSEYRHARKLVDAGTGPGHVNFYSEIADPLPVVHAPVHVGHHHKKRLYKPWTWFK